MALVANGLLVVAGLLIVATRDRRALALALGVVPLAVVLVELAAGLVQVGLWTGLAGIVARLIAEEAAVAVLALSAASARPEGSRMAVGLETLLLPLLAGLLLAFGVFHFAAQSPAIPGGEAHWAGAGWGPIVTFSICWLVGVGMLAALLTRDPFKLGVAFLLMVVGVGLAARAIADPLGIGPGAATTLTIAAEGGFAILLALATAYFSTALGAVEDSP